MTGCKPSISAAREGSRVDRRATAGYAVIAGTDPCVEGLRFAEGTFIGTRTARNQVRIDDTLDTYATTGVVTDRDLVGNIVATLQATAQATQIKVAPIS
jgi:hypothetical protein